MRREDGKVSFTIEAPADARNAMCQCAIAPKRRRAQCQGVTSVIAVLTAHDAGAGEAPAASRA